MAINLRVSDDDTLNFVFDGTSTTYIFVDENNNVLTDENESVLTDVSVIDESITMRSSSDDSISLIYKGDD